MTEIKQAKKAGWSAYALGFLFWLPLLSGVVSRLTKQSNWFGDYGAIACASEKLLQGAPIYDRELSCPDVHGVVYVYLPIVAEIFAAPLRVLGQTGLFWAYAALFIVSCLALIWIMIGRASPVSRAQRSRFAAFLTGSAIYWGNIAVPLHALIGLIAITLRKRASLLVLAIALAAAVKPLFLTFAVIFLLREWPFWRRCLYTLATLILGLAPTALFILNGGALAEQWRELVAYFVYVDRPGEAFFGWLTLLGLPIATPGAALSYVAFAALVTLAGIGLAEGVKLDGEARTLLGLSLGVLLLPRLMPQDFWLLGPGLVALAATLSERDAGAGKALHRVLLALCIITLIGNMADLADYTTKLATFGLVLTLIIAAAYTLAKLTQPAAFWRQIWSGSAA